MNRAAVRLAVTTPVLAAFALFGLGSGSSTGNEYNTGFESVRRRRRSRRSHRWVAAVHRHQPHRAARPGSLHGRRRRRRSTCLSSYRFQLAPVVTTRRWVSFRNRTSETLRGNRQNRREHELEERISDLEVVLAQSQGASRRLEREADADPLTGLANHRAFHVRLSNRGRARAAIRPSAVARLPGCRRVQGRERSVRPPGRRQGAERGRRSADHCRARRGSCGADRGRRVRHPAPRDHRRGGGGGGAARP